MTSVLVATTIAGYKVLAGVEQYGAWLLPDLRSEENDVEYFASIETDGRGRDVFAPFIEALDTRGGATWQFSLNTNEQETSGNDRIVRICTGRNLCQEYASRRAFEWILFLDSDVTPPDDIIPKLLEMDHPIVGAKVPTYCLGGPVMEEYADYEVQEHWTTAGCLMVHASIFRRVWWGPDTTLGLTDDPAYQAMVIAVTGHRTRVRQDIIALHPGPIFSVENRGHDLRIVNG